MQRPKNQKPKQNKKVVERVLAVTALQEKKVGGKSTPRTSTAALGHSTKIYLLGGGERDWLLFLLVHAEGQKKHPC